MGYKLQTDDLKSIIIDGIYLHAYDLQVEWFRIMRSAVSKSR